MPIAEPFQRLPTNVQPKNYKISLQPNLIHYNFKGSSEIEVQIHEATNRIVLNSLHLNIGPVTVKLNDGIHKSSEIILNLEKEIVEFVFPEELPKGSALISFDFEGTLNDKLKGFYHTKYTVGTEVRYGAVTQFEATDARRCFPCWDEPAIKATFDITLIVPKNRVALSNMNEISRSSYPSDDSLHVLKFARTPIMSTYLVAIAVGEYDYVGQVLPNGVEIKVYTPVGKKEQGLFALEVASKVLPYYTDYFKIDYPLPKMDLIAIPDFAIGAMENWGLITYRETCLLVDPHNSSASQKQRIALVVGHEIAHQWFGNLVTMEWWTHLWLNEGYATFGENLCIDNLFPNFDIWTQFVTRTYTCALELDALRNSHPVEVPVGHPSEVDEIFDDISYNKGASIIRMIHNYIGDEDFRKGMNIYLNRHKFNNTSTKDLWAALSEASGKPIAQVMSHWTEKTGFPMISITSRQDGNNRIIQLNQSRFLADGSVDENQCEWIIPISIMTSKHPSFPVEDILLDSKSTEVVLEGVSSEDWVKINVNSVGYFRTMYPPQMLEQLKPAISSKTLPPIDRLGVIDDLFAMVSSGHSSTVDVLRFLKSYEDETNYTVWASIHNIISQLNYLVSHTSYQSLFTTFVKKLLAKIFVKLGWEPKPDESHLDTLLRSLVLLRLGMYGESSVVEEAKRRLNAHLNGTAQVSADIRNAVYKTVMSQASESTFQQMLELYRKADLNEEKVRISTSLGATREPNLIQKVLQFAMSDEVRSQDTVFVIISVTHSKAGREAAWAFLKANLQQLINKYDGGDLIARLIKVVTENFASEEMAIEVEDFFKNKFIPGTERTVQQAVECIRLNAAWLGRDSAHIEKFLKEEA